MELIVTRPKYDDVTFSLSHWFASILKECDKRGIKYFDLFHEKANKSQVHSILSKNKSNLIVFNGHGSDDCIMGHKGEILITNKEDLSLLKNRVIYAIACNSAAKLGKDCVAQGTLAFIGYNAPFVIISNPNKGLLPLEDEYIKPLMEASNEVTLTLIKGNTVDEAYARSQIKFDYHIKKYQRNDAPPEAQNILPVLYWNKMAQTKIGNGETKLS